MRCYLQCLRKRIKKFTVIGTSKNGTSIPRRYVFYVFKLILKIQSSCKHCSKEYTGNVTHLKKHLGKCRIFLKTAKDKKESQNLLPQSKSATHTRNTQTRINFPRVSKPVPKKELSDAEKKDLDFKAAMWVFEENAPLTFFEDPYAKAFFQELNPLYTLPSAHKIAEILVDHIASQKKSGCTVKVPSRLNIYLKVSANESNYINSASWCDLRKPRGPSSTSWKIPGMRMTVAASTQRLRNRLLQLANHGPNRVNSFTNDASSTIFICPCDVRLRSIRAVF